MDTRVDIARRRGMDVRKGERKRYKSGEDRYKSRYREE